METRGNHFFVRHWNGETAPARALVGLLGICAGFHVCWRLTLNLQLLVEHFEWQVAVMVTLLATFLAIGSWHIIGTWRSLEAVNGLNRVERWGAFLGKSIVLSAAVLTLYIVASTMRQSVEIIQDIATAHQRCRIFVDSKRPTVAILDGEVAWGASSALDRVLSESNEIKILELNSVGGSVIEAERIASIVEARKLGTHVSRVCASACTWAYAGGSVRSATKAARFVFHRFSGGNLTSNSIIAQLTSRYREYLLTHGVDIRFVDAASGIAPGRYWIASASDLKRSGYVHVLGD